MYSTDGVDQGGAAIDLGVHHAVHDGGEQRRRHPLAGDIRDDGDAAVIRADDVIEVTAHSVQGGVRGAARNLARQADRWR